MRARLMCWLGIGIITAQRVPLVSALIANGRAFLPRLAQIAKIPAPVSVFSGATHAVTGATTEVKPWDG